VADRPTSLDRGFIGAVDIGATKTLLAVVPAEAAESTLALTDALRRPLLFATDPDPDRHLALVAARLREALGDLDLLAVGVAAPGPLDPGSGLIIHSPNLGWRSNAFGPALSAVLGAPVSLEDDANAGALGEALAGGGAGADPVVFLTLSTGVGAGLIVGGNVVHGAHQAAGEVGHFTVDPSGPRCACGGRGHVEAYIGGAALASRARRAWPDGRRADGVPAPRDAAGILAAARSGEPVARGLADDAVGALAVALAVVAAALDPERIVVGGSLGLGHRWLVRRAVTLARRRVMPATGRALTVVPASLGARAPLVGAAILASRRVGGRFP
jgi:glucokinase